MNFRPYQKGTLRGFFSVVLPSGLTIHECKLFEKDGGRWVGWPSRPFVGKDGCKGYAPVVEFASRESSEGFRDAVLVAMKQANLVPESPRPAGPPQTQIPPEIDDADIPF